jgi:hypothetical protein
MPNQEKDGIPRFRKFPIMDGIDQYKGESKQQEQ